MLIHDVCSKCNLTKKAVEYYEKQGLIHPKTGENGYRIYSDRDIAVLKEISVLRRLGISVADIKAIIQNNDKPAALARCKRRMELELQQAANHLKIVERLIDDYDIEREITHINEATEVDISIKKKLERAFPGSYGMYLSVHFGQFLNETIDSPKQQQAYDAIIAFLDNVENLSFSPELTVFLENSFRTMQEPDLKKMNEAMLEAIDNIDGYIDDNQTGVEEYLAFRTSEEFKESPVYAAQQLFLQFQQSSGYHDIFIPNLKILSTSYRTYLEKLEAANTSFLSRFPEAKGITDISGD